ncbi:MAG TPA: TIGR02147 family protein, partial [Polyangiales bacterium]|nr:TIGR02147 family protein [Polyangiales bacterium]
NIFAYLDYRQLLRDLYAHKKRSEYGFSHRAFSRRAGLASVNLLKLVMDGKRNISAPVAERFAKALTLRGAEADYFCELVQFNQARSVRDRERAHERLVQLRPQRALRMLEEHQAAYCSHWYIPAIRELAARADFRDDPSWIGQTLLPKVSKARVIKALKVLVGLNLLQPDALGVLRPVDAMLTTGFAPLGHQIAGYHRAMLERASEAIDLFPRDEREFGALTLCIDESLLPAIRERVQTFRQELMRFAESEGERRRLLQVNFQVFPLSVSERQ